VALPLATDTEVDTGTDAEIEVGAGVGDGTIVGVDVGLFVGLGVGDGTIVGVGVTVMSFREEDTESDHFSPAEPYRSTYMSPSRLTLAFSKKLISSSILDTL
jgi:hypothetical protein